MKKKSGLLKSTIYALQGAVVGVGAIFPV